MIAEPTYRPQRDGGRKREEKEKTDRERERPIDLALTGRGGLDHRAY